MNKYQLDAMSAQEKFNCVLEGIAYYASVHTPNMSAVRKFKADPFFGLTLGLNEEGVKRAQTYGLEVKPADDRIPHPHVVFKNKLKPGKDVEKVKPEVVDTLQNEIPPTILIGNESKVACKFSIYWNEFGGKVGSWLSKVQVVELVPYFPDKSEKGFANDGKGFTVESFKGPDEVKSSPASSESIFDE